MKNTIVFIVHNATHTYALRRPPQRGTNALTSVEIINSKSNLIYCQPATGKFEISFIFISTNLYDSSRCDEKWVRPNKKPIFLHSS